MPEHPAFDALLTAAEGGAGSDVLSHVADCEPCRRRIAKLRGFLATAAEELLDLRSDCPSPDELSALPPGAEHSDPHLQACPLCREEVRMLFELESERRLGVAAGAGDFYRPEPLQRGGGPVWYQRGSAAPPEMELKDGNELDVRLGTARVRIKCMHGEMSVRVDGEVEGSLVLVLSDSTLEKRRLVSEADATLPVEHWQQVRVEVEPEEGR